MAHENLKERTIQFALRILEVVDAMPNSAKGRNIGNQLCRCGTSVAAARAKSKPDFIYKLSIVEEEADEALFWLELIVRAGILPPARLEPLISEGSEILAITVSSIRTAKRNKA